VHGASTQSQHDDDYFRIGCVYDEDAVALRERVELRAEGTGGPWLGAFDPESMDRNSCNYLCGENRDGCNVVPWWEDEIAGSNVRPEAGRDPKRQRVVQEMMRRQLEQRLFRPVGVLGSHAGDPKCES
jgi:hypothetical protein